MGQKVLDQAGPRCPPNNSQHWEILLRLWYYTGSYYIRSLKNEGWNSSLRTMLKHALV
jgi:hypothetical protein